MIEYWAAKPTATARGIRAILRKSSRVSVNPMHNMMNASTNTTTGPWLMAMSRSGQLKRGDAGEDHPERKQERQSM